jgi:hypothetical protein
MSELSTRMDIIKNSLAAMYPARVVSRDVRDPAMIDRADLLKGVYTIVGMPESDYTNVNGYEAMDGRQQFLILGDLVLTDNQGGSKVEDAEGTMIDEIKAWVRSRPESLCLVNLKRVVPSGQTANPYGWIVCELEYQP